jgi:hypothetical protein
MKDYKYLKFTKRIDRRSPKNEGDMESPILRENWLSRDGVLKRPKGTEALQYYQQYGYDSYVVLLMHFRDTFKDEIGSTPTVYEDARIDRTDGAFGAVGCGLFDGTGDYVSFADSANWYFGSSDFTIDFRVKFADLTNAQVIIGQYEDANNYWYIMKDSNANDNKLSIKFVDGGGGKGEYVMTNAWSVDTAAWHQVEFNRNGASATLLIDGISFALTETTAFGANDVGDMAAALIIGQQNSGSYLNGRLDELRISKGIARHTTDFTLPMGEYEPDTGTGTLTSAVTWMRRYYTLETGQISPRTFAYTQDGKIWLVDDISKTVKLVKEGLNTQVYPKSWVFKTTEQYYLYLVDGRDTYKFDGNNDNNFEKLDLEDVDGNSIEPIDVMEHRDRLFLLTKTSLKISANLDPDTFDSATDSADIIVGSGQGLNKALGKIENRLFVGTSIGIYGLTGDVISALAPTFELELVDSRKTVSSRGFLSVENGIAFIADDLELYSFNGHSSQMLSYSEKLSDFINPNLEMLERMDSIFEDDYAKFSFVETGVSVPRLEIWYDTLNQQIDFVRGRNVGCYMRSDRTRETDYGQIGRSDVPEIMWVDRGAKFGTHNIVTQLWTRDLTFFKGMNLRFGAFYPEFEPTGDRSMMFTYFLDGRVGIVYQFPSGTYTGDVAPTFDQSLRGEYEVGARYTKHSGIIMFQQQNQFIDRIRPKIKYSRGTSISFLIIDSAEAEKSNFLGMGIEFIVKHMKKGRLVSK